MLTATVARCTIRRRVLWLGDLAWGPGLGGAGADRGLQASDMRAAGALMGARGPWQVHALYRARCWDGCDPVAAAVTWQATCAASQPQV